MADDDQGKSTIWKARWKALVRALVGVLKGLGFLGLGLVGVLYAGLVIVAAAVGLVALFRFLEPIWLQRGPTAPADVSGLRDRLIAIGALVTTPFLIWRLVVSHWAARAAQAQARIAQGTSRNTLFTKAVEQLGAMREERVKEETRDAAGAVTGSKETIRLRPNTEVRLGAIYALEKLAREDLDMHWPIMETLCAYVRENAGPARPPGEAIIAIEKKPQVDRSEDEDAAVEAREHDVKSPTVDIQAALTVIGRRSKTRQDYERQRREGGGGDAWRLDFQGAHLAKANLAGMRLAAARFDHCALYRVNAREADLGGAGLYGAHLEGAGFQRARLEGAWLEEAHFERARLQGVHFEGASLKAAHLDGAEVQDAVLTDALIFDADLARAIGLGQAQLNAAFGDRWTQIPDNLERPVNERWRESWPLEPPNLDARRRLLELYDDRREHRLKVAAERRRTSDGT